MKRPVLAQWWRAWGRRQLYSFFSSLGTLLGHRAGTALTVLVLGIAMALPLGLHVTLQNLRGFDLGHEDWGTLTVFLDQNAGAADAERLVAALRERGVVQATLVSPADGLAEFRAASGFGRALDILDANPLPWVIDLRPSVAPGENLADAVHGLEGWLEGQTSVDRVVVDYRWLQRLAALLALGEAVVLLLGVVFGLAVLVVVANTIRLDVANRVDEIEVLSLVGASDGFIRLPFLYSGFWYGILGAALALALLQFGIFYLSGPLEGLLDAYGHRFDLTGAPPAVALLVLGGGGLLGAIGAWLAVTFFLRALHSRGASGSAG